MLMCYWQCESPFYLRLAKRKTQDEGTFPPFLLLLLLVFSVLFYFFFSIPARSSKSTAFTEQSPQFFIKQRGTISTHLLITSIKIIKFYYYCYCCSCYCYAILYFQGPSSCGSHETSNKGARWAVRSLPRNCSWIN